MSSFYYEAAKGCGFRLASCPVRFAAAFVQTACHMRGRGALATKAFFRCRRARQTPRLPAPCMARQEGIVQGGVRFDG